METIEIDLNEFSRDLLIMLIELSCKRQESVDKVIVNILEKYVAEYLDNKENIEDAIIE